MEKTKRWVEQLKKKRDYLFYGLKKIGVSVPVLPSGGFYLLGDFRFLGIPSKDLAFNLLGEAGVATAPGVDFGEVSEGFLRFTFARPISELREGMKRIKKFLYDRGFLGRGTPS
jgi:aspartate/methionine/tyrosine aminotransferase